MKLQQALEVTKIGNRLDELDKLISDMEQDNVVLNMEVCTDYNATDDFDFIRKVKLNHKGISLKKNNEFNIFLYSSVLNALKDERQRLIDNLAVY